MIFEQIGEYLESHGIKQAHLVAKTSLTKQALSTALNGNRKISAEEYIEICNALNLPVDYFTEDSGVGR